MFACEEAYDSPIGDLIINKTQLVIIIFILPITISVFWLHRKNCNCILHFKIIILFILIDDGKTERRVPTVKINGFIKFTKIHLTVYDGSNYSTQN